MAYLMQFILKTSDQSRKILEPLFRYFIVAIGFLVLAIIVGIDGNAFLVISGSIGIGLGFNLKDTLSNLSPESGCSLKVPTNPARF